MNKILAISVIAGGIFYYVNSSDQTVKVERSLKLGAFSSALSIAVIAYGIYK